ncbi:MAG: hypothetical protein IPF63_10280 [Bacteroidetes bacterium]|nr:hypothetical protein [Bacteroidota bacterium]
MFRTKFLCLALIVISCFNANAQQNNPPVCGNHGISENYINDLSELKQIKPSSNSALRMMDCMLDPTNNTSTAGVLLLYWSDF